VADKAAGDRPVCSLAASFLAQDEVNRPAAPGVRPRLAAVTEDVGILAPRLFESIAQDGETVESEIAVDAMCQLDHGPVVPVEDGRADNGRAKGVAENVSDQFAVVGLSRCKRCEDSISICFFYLRVRNPLPVATVVTLESEGRLVGGSWVVKQGRVLLDLASRHVRPGFQKEHARRREATELNNRDSIEGFLKSERGGQRDKLNAAIGARFGFAASQRS